MAIVYQDNFNSGTLAGNGWTVAGAAALQAGTGVDDTQCVVCPTNASYIQRPITLGSTWSIFLSLNDVAVPDPANIVGVHLQHTSSLTRSIGWMMRDTLQISLLRVNSVIATSTDPIPQGFKRITFRVFMHATLGTATINVDGEEVINFAGDTQGVGFVGANIVVPGQLQAIGASTIQRFDNFAIGDSLTDADPFNPAITTTSPLPGAQVGVPYSTSFEVEGGTPPYEWSAGILPAGFLFDPTTAVLSAVSPSITGLFDIDITVTDANGTPTTSTFQIFIGSATCVPQEIGSILRGRWTHNSLVGPWFGTGPLAAGVFVNPSNTSQILINYTDNYGFNWQEITIDISGAVVGHNSRLVDGENLIHIVTQQISGRVSYSTFNLLTGLVVISNEEAVTSASITEGAVDVAIRNPSGSVVIFYETNRQNVLGTLYSRVAYKERIAGVWSAEVVLGNNNQEFHNIIARPIAGLENRIRFDMTLAPAGPNPDIQYQVLRGDNTLSGIFVWFVSGILGIPHYAIGDYVVYTDVVTGNTVIAIPVKEGGGPAWYLFNDVDDPEAHFAMGGLGGLVVEDPLVAGYPMFMLRYATESLHSMHWQFPNLGDPTWIVHKSGGPPDFLPAGNTDNQYGPNLPISGSATQEMGANVIERTGSVLAAYAAQFVALDTDEVKYQFSNVNNLPTTTGQTVQAWIDLLPEQIIEFDCAEIPPEPTETGCTHPLHRTDEYAAQSFSAGWVQAPVEEPYSYSVAITPPTTLQLIPASLNPGILDLCLVKNGPTLPLTPAAPIELGIPDDLTWAVKWGALAQLLNSDGDVRDPVRAKVCEDLYKLAVSVGRQPVTTFMVQVDDVDIPTSSIADLDQFQPEWQCVAGRPAQAAMVGANLLVLAGTPYDPDTGIPDAVYGITMDMARSFPVPDCSDPDNTYIQVGQELLSGILDMAQHILAFKMSGKEFTDTIPLRQNFLRMCGNVNAKLRSNAFYNTMLNQPASRQDDRVAKFVPRKPEEPE